MKKELKKTIRFSKNELEKIQEKLNLLNVNFSQFSRAAILQHNIQLPINRELLYEINKIGNNINQIAKAVNGKQKVDVLKQLLVIENQIKELYK
jgi:hypothetical protein